MAAPSIIAATRDLYRVALATHGRAAFEAWLAEAGRRADLYERPASLWPGQLAPVVLADLADFLASQKS